MPTIAYFVSPHGFGHAARAAAVMGAWPEARFEIFGGTPAWFFTDSLRAPFGYHPTLTDIGLVQTTPLEEDLPATLASLAAWLPFAPALVADLSARVRALGCRLVVCDISPLGLAVAQAAGLPAVLVENFTWDWIYHGYLAEAPELARYSAELADWFAGARRVQAYPACEPRADAALTVAPISRRPRRGREEVRRQLGLPADAPLVLATMGGIPPRYRQWDELAAQDEFICLLPGGAEQLERRGGLLLFPHHSQFYHPDLVHACDAVVGKTGYSTAAEVYAAGLPMGYVARPRFREAAVLGKFIAEQLDGLEIAAEAFERGAWRAAARALLARPRRAQPALNGAEQVVAFLKQQL